ncbi:hypothetical protein EDB81DRAFT_94701 [Dactylonectria macrodidyma]|uniref:Uncharacterized protein n=1 Tax=Dactylonectria macrodidyma TaxID=307937 RepID=A0A9P9EBQ9_9HYPO|nr:hypothetical protein EDB81DRAFT_94701 [Dactylonectria macrodidyma]
MLRWATCQTRQASSALCAPGRHCDILCVCAAAAASYVVRASCVSSRPLAVARCLKHRSCGLSCHLRLQATYQLRASTLSPPRSSFKQRENAVSLTPARCSLTKRWRVNCHVLQTDSVSLSGWQNHPKKRCSCYKRVVDDLTSRLAAHTTNLFSHTFLSTCMAIAARAESQLDGGGLIRPRWGLAERHHRRGGLFFLPSRS